MNRGINIKWLLLFIIWGGSFLLCFLNIGTINSILENRDKKEILQRDTVFWKQNEDNISEVTEQRKLLSHEVESLKLGMVFLDDTFNRFAAEFNLTDLKVDMEAKQSQGDSMPVKASFKCTLKNGLDVIGKIQKEYAFLPFKTVKIEDEKRKKISKFNILMDYRYHFKNI